MCLTKGGNLEKQLGIAAYWIGITSTAIALIMRALAWVGILGVAPGIGGGGIIHYPIGPSSKRLVSFFSWRLPVLPSP
jgi:hypothetical protein